MKFQMSLTRGILKHTVIKLRVHFYEASIMSGNINKTRKNLIPLILQSHTSHLLSSFKHVMLLVNRNASRHNLLLIFGVTNCFEISPRHTILTQ